MIGFHFVYDCDTYIFLSKRDILLLGPLRVNGEDFGPTKTRKVYTAYLCFYILYSSPVQRSDFKGKVQYERSCKDPAAFIASCYDSFHAATLRCRSCRRFCNVASLSLLNDVLLK